MLTRLPVVIILKYIKIANHYVVHPKLIQLTLEQHSSELRRSTYTRIFFFFWSVNTHTVLKMYLPYDFNNIFSLPYLIGRIQYIILSAPAAASPQARSPFGELEGSPAS